MDGQSNGFALKILKVNNLFLILFFLSDGTQHKCAASLTDLIYALVHVQHTVCVLCVS